MNILKKIILSAGFVALGLFSGESLAASVCFTSGGDYHCDDVIPKNVPVSTVCDDAPANMGRIATWCQVRGGTWDAGTQTCSGQAQITQANGFGIATAFEQAYHPSCEYDTTAATGSCSNWYCNCTNQSINGHPIYAASMSLFGGKTLDSASECTVPWSEIVVFATTIPYATPMGYKDNDNSGWHEGWKDAPCKDCAGNPIDIGTGSKQQVETDYVSAAPGGLSFVRRYSSTGMFAPVSKMPTAWDYWRHNYSAYIHAFPGNAYVMAAAVRPDGDPRYFKLTGVEATNNDGGAYRLQKLTDGGGNVTGWTLTTAESDVESYDAQGKLTSITTRSGLVTTLSYDTNNRLQTITDAFGRTITLAYDADGDLATMTDPSSRVYTYGYDSVKRLSTVTYPDTSVRTYVYENTNWAWALTGIIDERGARFATYGYDTTGRANYTEHAGTENNYTLSWTDNGTSVSVSAIDAFNTTHTYQYQRIKGTLKQTSKSNPYQGAETHTYDSNGNPLTFTDRRGMLTTYVFDSTRNLETSRTEASGTAIARTIATTWHSTFRLPATITEPSGVSGVNLVTTLTRDSNGNVTKKNLTAGTKVREWNYTYNSRGQLLTIDGPRTDVTDVTTIVYYGDSDTCVGCRSQVYTVTNAAGHVTTFDSYNLDGRPTQITDPNGVVTTLTYKPRGWLESRTAGGETTSYDYDLVGNVSKVTLPDGSWLQYQYDAANALVGMDDSLGNSIDYELDVMGNRVQEYVYDPQQALRKTLQRVYDGANRLQRELGAADQATEYGFDGNNNTTTVRDPLFRVTTNTYDQLNRLTNINDPANGNTVFTYDAKDRLLTVKDPKLSVTTSYTFDGLGNRLTQVSPDTGTTTFTFDDAGNVATQTDARSVTTTFSYDSLNRVTAASVTDGSVSYEYDNTTTGGAYAKGHLTKITDPSGNTVFVYDSLGRVTSKVQTTTASPSNKSFTIGYSYSSGRQTGITYPSGRAITYGFNSQGQVTSIAVDGTTTILSAAEYFPFGPMKKWTWGSGQVMERSFDLDGRIQTLTLGPSTATYADLSQVFGYDSLNRLVSANLAAGQAQSFTYDSNSNRTSATINSATTTYTYPSTSHKLSSLSGATTRSFSYDNSGSVTSSAGITYVFDGRGRMKQAGSTTYLVNGLGQRVKKNSGSDLFFAYDESGHLIGEYDTSGAAIEETIWLGDTPIAIVKPATPSGFNVFYIWADHLGTPRLITDTSNQSRWEWAHNDPFGNNAPNENPAGAGTFAYNLRFPGQYFDVETGKHYNYFRDYDSSLGRYLQSDPVWLRGGLNTYAYVGAAPLLWTDIYGLQRGGGWDTRYGNWCGSGWSGGKGGGKIPSNPAGPIDSVDECCMAHDYCYAAVEGCEKCPQGPFSSEKLSCDRTLVGCLEKLKGKAPQSWPKPPPPGTERDSYFFCQKAKNLFQNKLGM